MAVRADAFDLAPLRLSTGEGRRISLGVSIEPVELGKLAYRVMPPTVAVTLQISRMTGGGYALALTFTATVVGPCMRCLGEAHRTVMVEAREVDQEGGGEELRSPYVDRQILDLAGWARDALILAIPIQVLCRESCAGLCPTCAVDLNQAGPDHHHEREPDPRWAKLDELHLGSDREYVGSDRESAKRGRAV